MLDRLKSKKAEIERLREERGATDPILIIAGIAITLILLVGGSFAISGFITNANNLNAKGDLDRVATAQAAYIAEKDVYATTATALQNASLGFTPTAGNAITILASGANGWVAVTKSASGAKFVRTSGAAVIAESNAAGTTFTNGSAAYTLVLPSGITLAQVTTAIAAL